MGSDVIQTMFSCHTCDKSFKFAYALKKHITKKHDETHKSKVSHINPEIRDVSLESVGSNELSNKIEHGDEENKVLNCNKCKLYFKFGSVYKMHISIVHNSRIQEEMKCIRCSEHFDTRKSLRFHNSQEHGIYAEGESLSTCLICGTSVKQLRDHVRHMHEQGEHFKCTYCEKEFKAKYELTNHIRRKHETIASSCAFCGKLFKFLDRHLKTTNCGGDPDNIKKKVECNICGKCMSTKEKLKTHVKQIHNQVRDKQCDRCEYNTYSGGNLRLHINTQHLGMKIEKISCSECGKMVTNLEYHTDIYHPNL